MQLAHFLQVVQVFARHVQQDPFVCLVLVPRQCALVEHFPFLERVVVPLAIQGAIVLMDFKFYAMREVINLLRVKVFVQPVLQARTVLWGQQYFLSVLERHILILVRVCV